MLLDYLNYFSDAKVCFYSSSMELYVESDVAYFVAPKVKSCIAGYFYCSSNTSPPTLDGSLYVDCKKLRNVVTSTAEA